MFTAKKGNADCVDELIKLGADVNIEINGYTALIAAVKGRIMKCVFLLLIAGAHVNIFKHDPYHVLDKRVLKVISPKILLLLIAAGELFAASEAESGINAKVCDTTATDLKLNLKHLCREAIREHLLAIDPHENLFGRVPQLGLPSSLAKYLLYNMSLLG